MNNFLIKNILFLLEFMMSSYRGILVSKSLNFLFSNCSTSCSNGFLKLSEMEKVILDSGGLNAWILVGDLTTSFNFMLSPSVTNCRCMEFTDETYYTYCLIKQVWWIEIKFFYLIYASKALYLPNLEWNLNSLREAFK